MSEDTFVVTEEIVQKTAELGGLIFKFARVERVATHEDGVTPESDTDHTVMLGVVACAFAEAFLPHLDRGKVAQYALVHDLVEAYAGDTNTIDTQPETQSAKILAEKAALNTIRERFHQVYPWIYTTITDYETQASPEARFVKTLDKAMPSIAYVLSGAAGLKRLGLSKADVGMRVAESEQQLLATCAYDQPEAMTLRAALIQKYLREWDG